VHKGWASIIWNVDESYRTYSHINPDPAFQDSSLDGSNCPDVIKKSCVGWRVPCLRAFPYQTGAEGGTFVTGSCQRNMYPDGTSCKDIVQIGVGNQNPTYGDVRISDAFRTCECPSCLGT
jgi:hypothetical protein